MNNLFGGFNPSKLKAGECPSCSCQYSYMRTLHLVTFVTQNEGVMQGALINRRAPDGCSFIVSRLISKRACLVPRPDGRLYEVIASSTVCF
jgi:hypothetical protein